MNEPLPTAFPIGTQAPRAGVPGYAPEVWKAGGTLGQATRLFLLHGTAIVSCDQLLLVQPRLYLAPLGAFHQQLFCSIGVALLGLGFWGASRVRGSTESTTRALLLSGLTLAFSGTARFLAFDAPVHLAVLANVPAWISLGALGYALRRALRFVPQWLRLRDGSWVWLNPFALVGFVFGLVTTAILESIVGPVRSSLALGGALTVAAFFALLEERSSARLPVARALGYVQLIALCAAAVWAQSRCPLGRVLSSSHPLIYTGGNERCNVDVTAGQGGLHYFVNGELRFSSLDERRWSESITLPALARVPSPHRALVMSLGEGLVERELLRGSPDLTITSVVRDRRLADSARRQAYLRVLTRDSMLSRRVTLVEQDPAAFALRLGAERYDVIVVDLPDPAGPLEVKYYSRLFYRQLATHLSSSGLMTVQATSARRSPRSFATIGRTLEAAGLTAVPLMVPLITRGEWSLYLCARGKLPAVLDPAGYKRTFPGSLEGPMMTPWPDTKPPQGFEAKPNTLNDAVLLDWFEQEAEDPLHG